LKKSFLLIVALTSLFLAGSLQAQQRKGPIIEIKDEKFDFGKVVQGTQAAHVFEIRNAGTEPLIIEQVKPS